MTYPRVSIVLPIGNSTYLHDVLDDINAQTFTSWELVALIDSQNSIARTMLRGLIEKDRLHIVEFSNPFNLSERLNIGVRKAKGEFIARFDADDRYYPDRLLKQVQFLSSRNNSQIVLVGSAGKIIDQYSEVIGEIRYPTDYRKLCKRFMYRNSIIHPSVLIRKRVLLEFGYERRMPRGQDLELWLRVLTKHKIANLDEQLMAYRVHTDNHSDSRLTFEEMFQISMRRLDLSLKNPELLFSFLMGNSLWIWKNFLFSPASLGKIKKLNSKALSKWVVRDSNPRPGD